MGPTRVVDQACRMDEITDNLNVAASNPESDRPIEVTDEYLARAASGGDEAAFELIFERHRRRVAGVVGRFFNRPERIEELVQDTFTKLYFALGDYSPMRGASFSTWLSRIAINACYDELRKIKRRPETVIGSVSDTEILWLKTRLRSGTVAGDAESNAIARDLAEKLLARLSLDDRLVLTLLDAEETSVIEIAKLMAWSVSKVKVRAHRARATLRKVLNEFV
ncbi:MAG TPA: sigma-70 family RNA polymerase sigma factor [Blastocatellia bacterium]|nr:sigma-70 family RNA polymerase sigma factor [Blastocatellia bacterium]